MPPSHSRRADFRLGSKTEVAALRRDVCFAPRERTSSGCLSMSVSCQKATSVGLRLSDICEYLRQLFGPVRRDHVIGRYLIVAPIRGLFCVSGSPPARLVAGIASRIIPW